jgi:hypothetical protein
LALPSFEIKKVMRKLFFILTILLPLYAAGQKTVYNITDYGAKGDNRTLNTKAIQEAVDKCADKGGGTVVVPAGTFVTGCIVLKSNVNLHLNNGAVLLGSPDKDDYKVIVPRFESRTNDLYVNRSIIYAENAENVSLTGSGIIDGNGKHKNFSKTFPQNNRPFLARFVNCTNLTIRDVSMNESANWTCHLLGCKDVLIDGLKIKNSIRANRDGLDIDGCENITVSNCRIYSQDDAIVFKATGPASVKNATVTNCVVSSHASGIKFGTETTGGYENVTISNCVIKDIPVYSGLSMMIVDGGTMKNIVINNIAMDNVNIPIMIRLGNRARPYKSGIETPPPGTVENITISNVTATNAGLTSHITGLLNKRIKNVNLSNINIQIGKGFKGEPLPYNKVPFKEADYPSGQLYGKNLPASVLYVRNVDLLSIDNLKAFLTKEDKRIPFVFDNADDILLQNVTLKKVTPSSPVYFRNTNNAAVVNCRINNDLPVIVEEENCSDITLLPNPRPGIEAVKKTAALPDKTFEDINGFSSVLFEGTGIDGIKCYDLSKGNKNIELKAQKGRIFKLMFLSRSDDPGTINVKINDKQYKVNINNAQWSWNVLNVQNICKKDKVRIRISSDNGSPVCVSKIVLIPLSVTD